MLCCSPSPRSRRNGATLLTTPRAEPRWRRTGGGRAARARCGRAPSLVGRDRGGDELAGLDLRGVGLALGRPVRRQSGGSDLLQRTLRPPSRDAHLEQGRFDGADLAGADFSGAEAGEVSFDRPCWRMRRSANAGLRLTRACARRSWTARTWTARTSGARGSTAEANNTSLRGARLDEASLAGADLSGADLEDASLRRRTCAGRS